MARPRRTSAASETSSIPDHHQELGSMYDYLAKIILLGPSGSGKSCLLHRFTHNEFRTLSSQTIGVEFASKIIRIGANNTTSRAKRIKLQLWDTAGTERFRSVSRSYYRGAAGAVLVYDVASLGTFEQLPTFLSDARALASPRLTVLLAGNKSDLADPVQQKQGQGGSGRTQTIHMNGSAYLQRMQREEDGLPTTASSASSRQSFLASEPVPSASSSPSLKSTRSRTDSLLAAPTSLPASTSPYGREVPAHLVSTWSSRNSIPAVLEVSALSGENVDAIFHKLAAMILTKIELGEIDPDDPASGIQYGDAGGLGFDDGSSLNTDGGTVRRRKGGGKSGGVLSLGEWEDVFRRPVGRSGRCC